MSAQPGGADCLLIGGALVAAASGATYPNVDPSTEQALGVAADAQYHRHGRAIDAARRRVRRDPSGPPTSRSACAACASSTRRSLGHVEELRDDRRGRGRRADRADPRRRSSTRPIEGVGLDRRPGRALRVDRGPRRRQALRHRHRTAPSCREPIGVVGAITPWNFPDADQPGQGRARAGRRQHRRAQARARHAVDGHPARPHRRRGDRHPGGRASTSSPPRATRSASSSPKIRASTSCRSPGRRPPAAG